MGPLAMSVFTVSRWNRAGWNYRPLRVSRAEQDTIEEPGATPEP
jgi:hypothetical protein